MLFVNRGDGNAHAPVKLVLSGEPKDTYLEELADLSL